MRHLVGMAVMAAGLMAASGAQAQSWGVYVGSGAPQPYSIGWHDEGEDAIVMSYKL